MITKYIFKENNKAFDEYEVEVPKYLLTNYYKNTVGTQNVIESKKELIFRYKGKLYEVTREPYILYNTWNYLYCTRLLIFERLNTFFKCKDWHNLKIEIESDLKLNYVRELAV
jgi:hypothetical protein